MNWFSNHWRLAARKVPSPFCMSALARFGTNSFLMQLSQKKFVYPCLKPSLGRWNSMKLFLKTQVKNLLQLSPKLLTLPTSTLFLRLLPFLPSIYKLYISAICPPSSTQPSPPRFFSSHKRLVHGHTLPSGWAPRQLNLLQRQLPLVSIRISQMSFSLRIPSRTLFRLGSS